VKRNQTENARGGFVLTDDGRPVLQDQIAVWVSEGGAGGEVIRVAEVLSAVTGDIIAIQRTA
jgi:hypothetical protein